MMELLKSHLNWKDFSVEEKKEIGNVVIHVLHLKDLIKIPLLSSEGILTEQIIKVAEIETKS